MEIGAKKKVLAVDDDLDTLDIIKIKLEGSGYSVETATDGQMALAKVKSAPPDLIILDIMLPKLSGFKVARLLKFDKNLTHIPILFLSARTQKLDQDTGDSVGAEEYITKPFDLEALLSLVNRYLRK